MTKEEARSLGCFFTHRVRAGRFVLLLSQVELSEETEKKFSPRTFFLLFTVIKEWESPKGR